MKNVKWHMPVKPGPAKHSAQPALAIRTTYPDLAAVRQNSLDVQQHLPGIQRVLQNIRQYRHVIPSLGIEFFQQTGVDLETPFSRHGSGPLIELQALHSKSSARIQAQATAFIAANIEQPPRATSRMK